jgi:hypothetical protein
MWGLDGHYPGQFLVGELRKFGREIEDWCENVKRVAEFSAVEHYLQIKAHGDGHGRVRVDGEARERLGARTVLAFEFEIDRGTLHEVAQGLLGAGRME